MTTSTVELRRTRYDSAEVVALTERVQRYYVAIYGGPDDTPFTADEFAPPRGGFLLGSLDGRPVAMGGWRFTPYAPPPGARRPAEIKRMFVAEEARGRGLARALLRALENEARAAGADWMVLETGQPQQAAVGLYRSSGYVDVPPFGFYGDKPSVISLGRRLRDQPTG